MRYILGIDQGGTKTIAAVANEHGSILAVGCADGACHCVQGMNTAMQCVREATEQALDTAGCSLEDIEIVYAGMTGADWPYEYEQLGTALRELFRSSRVIVDNDCMIAMRSGSDRTNAAVICVGTGMNAAVRTAEGERYIYGYYINHEDSGGEALGRLALKAVFNAACGLAPSTGLTEKLLSYYGVVQTDELLRLHSSRQLGDYKWLAPCVFETANEGDQEANHLVEQFGIRLARYVTVASRRMGIVNQEIDVVLTGSIFKTDCLSFHRAVERTLQSELDKAKMVHPRYEPVIGSVLFGLEELHNRLFPLNSIALETREIMNKLIRN
jgi:N-acetylglucosamine kinase-like BadF-type ATPase